jgi:hypothetical protein
MKSEQYAKRKQKANWTGFFLPASVRMSQQFSLAFRPKIEDYFTNKRAFDAN